MAAEKAEKRAAADATKSTVKKINASVEKTTLGDIAGLARAEERHGLPSEERQEGCQGREGRGVIPVRRDGAAVRRYIERTAGVTPAVLFFVGAFVGAGEGGAVGRGWEKDCGAGCG